MCGISLVVQHDPSLHQRLLEPFPIITSFESVTIAHRGPDRSCKHREPGIDVVFHRLAIHDLTEAGDQPFFHGGPGGVSHLLCCNGEIYNYQALRTKYNIQVESDSDCAILLPLLHQHHCGQMVPFLMELDGVFAMTMIKRDTKQLTVVRDSIGVKPLFFRHDPTFHMTWVSSEAKGLELCPASAEPTTEVPPGTIMTFSASGIDSLTYWRPPSIPRVIIVPTSKLVTELRILMIDAVRKRMGSDRGLCCMLSGGLDSSIVAAILQSELKTHGQVLDTFSVGFPDSTDLVYARQVASFLGTRHHEIHITYEEALRTLRTVVYAIESYDTTTVRASTPMYLLSKAIAEHGHRVVFSGEGSDELFAGYLYNHLAPSDEAVRADATRLVTELYQYDVLRADRCTSAHGLEFREPFLDQNLVSWALSLPGQYIRPCLLHPDHPDRVEKHLLREAFRGWLPDSVIDRRKAAFSDAVSGAEKPWFRHIHEHFGLSDAKKEHELYREWFHLRFRSYSRDHIPLWLPRWVQGPDAEPSATALSVYRPDEHQNIA